MLAFFGAVFVSFWLKFTVTVNFFLLVLKCLKFNCFMLQSQQIKCLVLSRCPHSDLQSVEQLTIKSGGRGFDSRRGRRRYFSSPRAISHFLIGADAQLEIHGFTLALYTHCGAELIIL